MNTPKLSFSSASSKNRVFHQVRSFLEDAGFYITDEDNTRPWGGYFVIDEKLSELFIRTFFQNLSPEELKGFQKLSPKILMVAPGRRLSWQYHRRRSEIWKLIGGSALLSRSFTDKEKKPIQMPVNKEILLEQGERHRLIGTHEWGIVAEIWKHTNIQAPSDEEDIVRLQDDYQRG